MEIGIRDRCVKLILPNGEVVDVLTPVIEEMGKWVQDESYKPESGGYIVGYQHKNTGNISLESVSSPFTNDEKNRVRFNMKDPRHKSISCEGTETEKLLYGCMAHSPTSCSHPIKHRLGGLECFSSDGHYRMSVYILYHRRNSRMESLGGKFS